MWPLPTPGPRPHDPLATSDGALWYSGQMINALGRLDPKSGSFVEFPLKTPHSGLHGLVEDKEGNIWYTGNAGALIGKLDPKTGYTLPDAASRPRRMTITSDDIVWYADFSRGCLGRLDPATGKVSEWSSPSGPNSEPYGISAINDIIWYSESDTSPNTIVRFDPKTSAFQTWAIPGGGNIVRNTSVTPDGNFVLANSLVNTVTLVTIPK